MYRKGGVGDQKISGEFVTDDDWDLLLNICRFAFWKPGVLVLSRLGADVSELQALTESAPGSSSTV